MMMIAHFFSRVKEVFHMKENQELRQMAKANGVPLWACALKMGISEATIIRWLRVPLSYERELAIRDTITELAEGGAHGRA